MNPLRLLPVLIISLLALSGLRLADLILGEQPNAILTSTASAQETEPAEEKMEPNEAEEGAAGEDAAAQSEQAEEKSEEEDDPALVEGREIIPGKIKSAEEDVIRRLGERRKNLETRSRNLDTREKLLTATLKRIEERGNKLKALEKQVGVAVEKKKEQDDQRLIGLIKMYESMKAKDAARIFDRLGLGVLVPIVERIKPKKMALILAKMSDESAERLTIALAGQRQVARKSSRTAPRKLPKIEGSQN